MNGWVFECFSNFNQILYCIWILQSEVSPSTEEKAETNDVPVDTNGNCIGYPCPLAIKIFSEDFSDSQFNGYYVSNFPIPYGNSKLIILI